MPVILRRTKWPSHKDDWSYQVFDGDQQIGEIARQANGPDEWWVWTLRPFTARLGYKTSGVAKSLHLAEHDLQETWDAAERR
jgi:hypothetical protein